MKKTLAVMAATSAMILASAASAAFVGVTVVQKPAGETFGLFVCNVYAVFNSPNDELVAVAT